MDEQEILNKILVNFPDIIPFTSKPVIYDTGPLILLICGYHDSGSIGKSQLTKEFTIQDFYLLNIFNSLFNDIIITPQVLAECSNLINKEVKKDNYSKYMYSLIDFFNSLQEIYINKNKVLAHPEFSRLGFTDTSIMECSKMNNLLIVTKDLNLVRSCQYCMLPIIHFDQVRSIQWMML